MRLRKKAGKKTEKEKEEQARRRDSENRKIKLEKIL